MGYEDFVYFMLSEEDKSSEPSLEYWYLCIPYFYDLVTFCALVVTKLAMILNFFLAY